MRDSACDSADCLAVPTATVPTAPVVRLGAGEFIYTGPLVIPPTGGKQIYSCNEGNALAWDPAIRDAVDEFKGAKGGKPYALRYVGSMVSDVHRTLCYGGETTATTALAACFCLLA